MKIKSTYLGVEFDIPMKETESAGELVTLIPHDALKDLVYNSPEAKKLNLQPHSTPIIAEPGHYAFICSMSDNTGRRVESMGESIDDTRLTKIARDYPTSMAFNRAFDAAAIDFFGFPGKVYSDWQINDKQTEQSKVSSNTAGNKEAAKSSGKATKEEKEAPATKGKANENDKPFPAAETKAAQETTKAAKESKEPVKEETTVKEAITEETAAVETTAEGTQKDEFDETIIVVGSMKRAGLSVRECYKQKPDAVRWIAYSLTGKAEIYQAQKDVCQRFLQSIGDTEGEMNNAS